jgi:hypothetical protein
MNPSSLARLLKYYSQNMIDMHTYKITMEERQKDGSIRTLTQTAYCRDRQEAIEWYGLNEPDIVSYTITEV